MVLPRLGRLRLKEQAAVQGRILSATVRERAGRWFVSFRVEQSLDVPENQGPSVGVDLGVTTLATFSQGGNYHEEPNSRPLRSRLRRLKRLQRRFSRSKPGGNRRKQLKARIARLHYRIYCIRQDTLHKLTSHLAKDFGAVGIEDLNVEGMAKNHKLAQAILDCGFGEFRRQLEYKCQWYGSILIMRDRFFASTKICSKCDFVNEAITLADREWTCHGCGFRHLRPQCGR